MCTRWLFVVFLFLAGNANAQEPSPAHRAVEQALTLPPTQRAEALLRVAQVWPDSPAGERAFDVGLGCLAAMFERMESVPVLRDQLVEDDSEFRLAPGSEARHAAGRLLAGFDALYRSHRDEWDDAVRARAETLLFELTVATPVPGVAWLRPGQELPAPDLSVAMTARAWPWQPGSSLLEHFGTATYEHALAKGRGHAAPALGKGVWALELRENDTRFAARRLVAVTDLEVEVVQGPEGIVAFVHRQGAPIAGAQVGWRDGVPRTTNARGLVGLASSSETSEIVVRYEEDEVFHSLRWGRRGSREPGASRVHVAVDAPLYRPGHLLRGRVAVRGIHRGSVEGPLGLRVRQCVGSVPADEALKVRVHLPEAKPAIVPVVLDASGCAAFEHRVPEDTATGWVRIDVLRKPESEKSSDVVLHSAHVAEIAAYARSPLTLDLRGPEVVAPDAESMEMVATLRWAHGAPAVGRPVKLEVWGHTTMGRKPTQVKGVSDADGRVVFPVTLTERSRGAVGLRFEASSGKCRATWDGPPERTPSILRWELDGQGRGVVHVRGEPGSRALVTLFRETPAWADILELGVDGTARVVLPDLGGLHGEFDVAVLAGPSFEVKPVHLPRRRGLHAVTLELPPTVVPGERAAVTVRCRDAFGSRVTGTIALAVVDERLLALRGDLVTDPRVALRPAHERSWFGWWRGPRWADADAVLGVLVEDGRVRTRSRAFGSPGPASGGVAGHTAIRSDFRAVAHFVAVQVVDGEVRIEVPFPDDLTTWRLTCWAVGDGLDGVRTVVRTRTELPLAVEAALPRVLRVGDRLDLPVAVQSVAPGAVQWEGRGDGAAIVGESTGDRRVGTLRVEARTKGAGEIVLGASGGENRDAQRREIPVLADTLERLEAEGRVLRNGVAAFEAESEGDLVLFAPQLTARTEAEAFLRDYPYGCVEQTLSRITPYLVRSDLSEGERKRRDFGLRRLRDLLVGPDHGFAWWPDESADLAMTGLVTFGLAEASVERDRLPMPSLNGKLTTAAVRRLRQPVGLGSDGIAAAEWVAGALRASPQNDVLRANAAALVRGREALPAGLLVRLGLALAGAGEREMALVALRRVDGGDLVVPPARPSVRFPGEDPLAIAADAVRLARALERGIDGALLERLELRLFDAFASGRGTTYGLARAVVVLAGEDRDGSGASTTLKIRCAGRPVETVVLDAEDPSKRLRVPAGTVRVEGPDGAMIAARHLRKSTVSADDAQAWREGLQVRCEGGPFVAGVATDIHMMVTADVDVSRILLECPLPAGFEVVDPEHGWDVRDDRAFVGRSFLAAGKPWKKTLKVVPGMSGSVLWPPVTAHAMYAPEFRGGTAGRRVEIQPFDTAGLISRRPGILLERPYPARVAAESGAEPRSPTPEQRMDALLEAEPLNRAAVIRAFEDAVVADQLDDVAWSVGQNAVAADLLTPRMLAEMGRADADTRDTLWRALPDGVRRSMSAATIQFAMQPSDEDDLRWLLESEPGRKALSEWLRDPEFVDEHGDDLLGLAGVGHEIWRHVAVADFGRMRWIMEEEAAHALAASPRSDGEIVAFLCRATDADRVWLAVRALHRRGYAGDGLPTWAADVLASRRGDPDAAWRLRELLPDEDGEYPEDGDPLMEEVFEVFAWALVPQATPRELAWMHWSIDLPVFEARCRALSEAERVVLIDELRRAEVGVDRVVLPGALSPRERAALWAWARAGDEDALDRLTGSKADNLALRRRILNGGVDPNEWREPYEDATGRDLETGELRGGNEALWLEVVRGGWDQEWSEAERARAKRLRRWLGTTARERARR